MRPGEAPRGLLCTNDDHLHLMRNTTRSLDEPLVSILPGASRSTSSSLAPRVSRDPHESLRRERRSAVRASGRDPHHDHAVDDDAVDRPRTPSRVNARVARRAPPLGPAGRFAGHLAASCAAREPRPTQVALLGASQRTESLRRVSRSAVRAEGRCEHDHRLVHRQGVEGRPRAPPRDTHASRCERDYQRGSRFTSTQ